MPRIYDKTDTFHWSSEENNWDRYEDGDIFISLDPQERLGEGTICVSKWSDGIVQLGLFWSKEEADRYAQAYTNDLKRGLA